MIYGGSGSSSCNDGENLYICTFYGESEANFSGVVCATPAQDAANKSEKIHGSVGGIPIVPDRKDFSIVGIFRRIGLRILGSAQ